MKLGILNDFLPSERAGGAARAIQLFLAAKPEEIEAIFCKPGQLVDNCDGYLAFLTKSFSNDEMSFLQTRPFVWCGFDWWPDEDGNGHWRNLLVQKARLSIFASPLHKERFCRLYGADPTRAEVLPPPLSLEALSGFERPSERKPAVWAAEWHVAKGPDLAAVLARKLKVHVDMYSPSMPANIKAQANVFTPFAHPKGFSPELNWYQTLASYEQLLHTPRVPDAFGYIMLEAYALGLKTTVTGLTGVESFDVPWYELLVRCGESNVEFWQLLEAAF